MRKVISVVLIMAMCMSFVLCGCGSKYDGEVNVYNWGEYIDESIFDDFEKEYNIKVNYSTFNSNEALYSVLKNGGASYDVIVPSDYMISRMINEDMLEKLDFSNIPNYANVSDNYKNLEYDPTGEYTVAYLWGTVGLIYNTAMIDEEITSWTALFDEKYSGDILMFDNSRDALAIALLTLGYSVNTTDEGELREAYDLLKNGKDGFQAFVMDQIFDKLESGEAAIGPYYAGDYVTMVENNPDLAFVLPDEGTTRFVDAMCIPKGCENKENAEKFINFMCENEISMRNMDEVGYASPIDEVCEEYAADLDEDIANVMFPDSEYLSGLEVFKILPQEALNLYDELWVDLKA